MKTSRIGSNDCLKIWKIALNEVPLQPKMMETGSGPCPKKVSSDRFDKLKPLNYKKEFIPKTTVL